MRQDQERKGNIDKKSVKSFLKMVKTWEDDFQTFQYVALHRQLFICTLPCQRLKFDIFTKLRQGCEENTIETSFGWIAPEEGKASYSPSKRAHSQLSSRPGRRVKLSLIFPDKSAHISTFALRTIQGVIHKEDVKFGSTGEIVFLQFWINFLNQIKRPRLQSLVPSPNHLPLAGTHLPTGWGSPAWA